MAIKCINPLRTKPYAPNEIDLTGPAGNAFFLFSLVESICWGNGIDPTVIIEEMMDGDYEHLVATIERFFGNSLVLYRSRADIKQAKGECKPQIRLRKWRRSEQLSIVKEILAERFSDAFEVCSPRCSMGNEIVIRWTVGSPVEQVEAYLHSRLPIDSLGECGLGNVEYQGAAFRPIAATFERVLANGVVETHNPALTIGLDFHHHGVMAMAVARYMEAVQIGIPNQIMMALDAIRFLRNEGFDFCLDSWPQALVDFLNNDSVLALERVALNPDASHARSRRL